MAVGTANLDLAAGRQGLTHLAGHQPAHAEAAPEERRVDTAALARPLGEALPGTDHRLASRVLLEPARQLRVLDVMEEVLELVFVLGPQGDREISEPDDLQAVAVDVALHLGDRLRLALVRVGRDAEQRPTV